VWWICKVRYHPLDAGGSVRFGARWTSSGRAVLHASDSFAGALLEILCHASRPRTLPGAHYAVRLEIPHGGVEVVEPDQIHGWEHPDFRTARRVGDAWMAGRRSVGLLVPSLPSRPEGRIVLLDPGHPDFTAIRVSAPFPVPWDERLFR